MGHGGFKVDETDRCTFACGKTAQYLRQYSSGSWERVGKYAGRCALAGPEPEAEPEPALDHGDPVQSELEPGPHSEVIEKADDGLMLSPGGGAARWPIANVDTGGLRLGSRGLIG